MTARLRAAAWIVLLGLVGAFGTAALQAAPAQACSCAEQPLADQYARADAVFTARLVSRTVDHGVWGRSSSNPAHLVLAVDSVLKGEVHGRQGVDTEAEGCGVGIDPGTAYLVLAQRDGAAPTADLCGGTSPLSSGLQTAATALSAGAAPPLAGDADVPGDSPWPGLRQVAAGIVALMLLVAVLLRRRSRRAAVEPGHWLWG